MREGGVGLSALSQMISPFTNGKKIDGVELIIGGFPTIFLVQFSFFFLFPVCRFLQFYFAFLV